MKIIQHKFPWSYNKLKTTNYQFPTWYLKSNIMPEGKNVTILKEQNHLMFIMSDKSESQFSIVEKASNNEYKDIQYPIHYCDEIFDRSILI